MQAKKQSFNSFLSSGTPWVWLNAGAVAISMIMVIGLLLLIASRGLGHFWPKTVYQIEFDNGNETVQVIGERVDTEEVARKRIIESGLKVNSEAERIKRSLIKVGNREILGIDFMHTVEPNEISVSKPVDVLVLERTQWGNFYGFLQNIKSEGEVLNLYEDIKWQDLEKRLERVFTFRERIEHIEKGEIGAINYKLEKLRLKKRGLELDGVANPNDLLEIDEQSCPIYRGFRSIKRRVGSAVPRNFA